MKAVCITVLLCLILSGCSSHAQGTKTTTITKTWNNKTVIDNPVVEITKAFKGTSTGNTGRGFQIYVPARKSSSRTRQNMGGFYRP